MRDISDKSDIKIFVDSFYTKVQKDALLGPVFAAKIQDQGWPKHLERMYSFWNTVLFSQVDYRGNPFAKHAPLPLEAKHFERWVGLFKGTIDEYFAGAKAEDAKDRAEKMGQLFAAKIAYLRANDQYRNIL
ncbi:MAG: group III truncated hemoglobin [Bacteroidota bacterium]